VRLPPYSSELNPVENPRHDPRSQHWSNRKYDTADDLFAAAETAWQATCLTPETILSVWRAPDAVTRDEFVGLVGLVGHSSRTVRVLNDRDMIRRDSRRMALVAQHNVLPPMLPSLFVSVVTTGMTGLVAIRGFPTRGGVVTFGDVR
jgi:hypothetical protein